MGTYCAPLKADLFYIIIRGTCLTFSNPNFTTSSTCLTIPLDIFIIDNPEFEKRIPDIYQSELQLYKENTSDKETYSLNII